MSTTKDTAVETLLGKAVAALNAVEAMNYAQAACNAANALRALAEAEAVKRTNS